MAAFCIAVCAALQFLPTESLGKSRWLMLLLVGVFIVTQATFSLVTTFVQGDIIFKGCENSSKKMPAIAVSSTKKEKYSELFTIIVKLDKGSISRTLPLVRFFTTKGVFLVDELAEELDFTFSPHRLNEINTVVDANTLSDVVEFDSKKENQIVSESTASKKNK